MIRESRLAGPVALTLGSIAAVCVAVAGPLSEPSPSGAPAAEPAPVSAEPGARFDGVLDAEAPRTEEQKVELVAEPPQPGPRFLAAESLDPDHPIVRLQELRRLRGALDDEAENLSEKRKSVASSIRDVREEAKAAAEALHAASVDEARQFLNERRDALYAMVDEAFGKHRVEPLRALRIDLEAPLPLLRVEALDAAIHGLAHSFEDDLFERVSRDGVPSERRLRSVGNELSSRIHERIQDPWESVVKRHAHHADSLGADHDERVQWVEQQLESIRTELRERIDCAVGRSVETYSDALRTRLASLDVPHSDEVAASLADISAQLDAWTTGFVRGANDALATYVGQVQPAREALPASLTAHLAAGETGQATLLKMVDAILAERFAPPLETETKLPAWRNDEAARTFVEDLRTHLGNAVNAGRDSLRADANAIDRLLSDEDQRSDEAWKDLRSSLKRWRSRAKDDCWKLDGPHLDGRFIPKLKDKFVMAD